MKGIVDRIEGGIAAVETDGGMCDVPAPEGLECGDIVTLSGGKITEIDREATRARRARLQERLDRMRGKHG